MIGIDLNGKTAIVTGARRGMGRTHSLVLAKAGAKVAVSDVSLEDCQKVVDEIKEQGGEALAFKCDVTNSQEIEAMVKEIMNRWGRIDVLVNNAGIAPFKPFQDLTEEDWDKVLDVNLKGCFLMAKVVVPQMIEQKSGSIINIASIASGQVGVGFPNLVHYVSSKGGIVAFTESLALELAPYNIRVNCISPGLIETPMIEPVKKDERTMRAVLARIPMGRAGKPEEISDVVLFLASDLSSYMTGSEIIVDGGWLAG